MKTIIRNGVLINEGKKIEADILVNKNRIIRIAPQIDEPECHEIDAEGLWVIPGIIDDQVHFREPGLTHKANIYTESRAAAAGGVTSYMEMPNVKPPTLTQELLAKKYERAGQTSMVNYSFYMGVSNDNLEEVLRTNPKQVCGLKVFMGSSTGNMLVDNERVLEDIFRTAPMLVATHCEDEQTIRDNTDKSLKKWGEDIPFNHHPKIRSVEACFLSSSKAVELAQKYGTRLHVLHISTEKELALFTNDIPRNQKKITAEVCVHHLFFDSSDYKKLGAKIKCNPAIKSEKHKKALLAALIDGRLDVVATDHAPHTETEKANAYLKAPSGLPLVQHSLNVMLDFYHRGLLTAELIVDKMCHAPADLYDVIDRGYIREGYFADLVLLDPGGFTTVDKENLFYKCGWSPFESRKLRGKIVKTLVNGKIVWDQGEFFESAAAMRLDFDRALF